MIWLWWLFVLGVLALLNFITIAAIYSKGYDAGYDRRQTQRHLGAGYQMDFERLNRRLAKSRQRNRDYHRIVAEYKIACKEMNTQIILLRAQVDERDGRIANALL
jgi:hypothetical protein